MTRLTELADRIDSLKAAYEAAKIQTNLKSGGLNYSEWGIAAERSSASALIDELERRVKELEQENQKLRDPLGTNEHSANSPRLEIDAKHRKGK